MVVLAAAIAAAIRAAVATCDLNADSPYRAMRYLMGTWCELVIFGQSPADAVRASEGAFDEIGRLERVMSNYDPESELSRLNAAAGGGPQAISADLAAVLGAALDTCRASGGAFDPTVGPLLQAWRFYTAAASVPSAAATARARRHVGCRHVAWDAAAGTAALDRGSLLDLGGIGKGYALDRAMAVLRRLGVARAKFDFGSSSLAYLGGEADGWPVVVKDPRGGAQPIVTFTVIDEAIGSSGIDQRSFTSGGRVYGHIFDPRTGEPVRSDLLAVTVVARTATEADALSTAAFVLGPRAGGRLIERTPGAAAIFVSRAAGSTRPTRTGRARPAADPAGTAKERSRSRRSGGLVIATAGHVRNLQILEGSHAGV